MSGGGHATQSLVDYRGRCRKHAYHCTGLVVADVVADMMRTQDVSLTKDLVKDGGEASKKLPSRIVRAKSRSLSAWVLLDSS